MRLILWDVDGTVLRAGSLTRDAFDVAAEEVLGGSPGAHGMAMSGKTDPQIAHEIMEAMSLDEEAADAHLPAILEEMEAALAGHPQRLRDQGYLMPGVEALLARLDAEPDVVQTVLTGNIAPNAVAKLSALDLDKWFDLRVGAFGSDHRDRDALVPIAVDRVQRVHGRTPEVVWVVGDTPNDLACARAGGARCLLVATGRVDYEELAQLPADAVRHDLSDVDAVASLLLGEPQGGQAEE